ncbi:MAG: hypothetical protein NXI00_02850 [Cytophagales bacterium]|nr:hypothetical protein [Cytophagales bacterium]
MSKLLIELQNEVGKIEFDLQIHNESIIHQNKLLMQSFQTWVDQLQQHIRKVNFDYAFGKSDHIKEYQIHQETTKIIENLDIPRNSYSKLPDGAGADYIFMSKVQYLEIIVHQMKARIVNTKVWLGIISVLLEETRTYYYKNPEAYVHFKSRRPYPEVFNNTDASFIFKHFFNDPYVTKTVKSYSFIYFKFEKEEQFLHEGISQKFFSKWINDHFKTDFDKIRDYGTGFKEFDAIYENLKSKIHKFPKPASGENY